MLGFPHPAAERQAEISNTRLTKHKRAIWKNDANGHFSENTSITAGPIMYDVTAFIGWPQKAG